MNSRNSSKSLSCNTPEKSSVLQVKVSHKEKRNQERLSAAFEGIAAGKYGKKRIESEPQAYTCDSTNLEETDEGHIRCQIKAALGKSCNQFLLYCPRIKRCLYYFSWHHLLPGRIP